MTSVNTVILTFSDLVHQLFQFMQIFTGQEFV
jgi:hypothetical protein